MSWFAQREVPCRSRSQCSDVSCGQHYGHCGRRLSCLSQERRASLTVQRCPEAWNDGPKCAQQCEGHMLTCGVESGNVSETLGMKPTSTRCRKCKAHLSKSEQAKLDEAARLTTAGNAWADELAKEGARDDSFQSILYDTYKAAVETSNGIIDYIGNFILRAKGGGRWPDVVTPPQGWDEKDERWKHATSKDNRTAKRVASTQVRGPRRQNWL